MPFIIDNLPKLQKKYGFGKLSVWITCQNLQKIMILASYRIRCRHITPNACIIFLLASASEGSNNVRIYIKVVDSLV